VMERKMVCISCPLGCRLTVTWSEGSEVTVKGNRCAKGESYAREEILAPAQRAHTGPAQRNVQAGGQGPGSPRADTSKGFPRHGGGSGGCEEFSK